MVRTECTFPCLILFTFAGPSSPASLSTSGRGFRMYRPSENPPDRSAQTQKAPLLETVQGADDSNSSSSSSSSSSRRRILRVRQTRGLGDGWPSPVGAEGGNVMTGGSNSWTRAPLHAMEALIVTTPAMSGNLQIQSKVIRYISCCDLFSAGEQSVAVSSFVNVSLGRTAHLRCETFNVPNVSVRFVFHNGLHHFPIKVLSDI